MSKHIPRKRFGQHFLIDDGIINAIVAAIAPERSGTLVEIGPGQGALTLPLLARSKSLTVVELDRDLVAYWRARPNSEQLTVIDADALRVDFAALAHDQPLRVVGNLPYNISTPLIFHLLSFGALISEMVFMLQKELVDRICAGPGSKTYGKLSIMTQHFCHTEALFDVPPSAFNPPPKVNSAMLRLSPRNEVAQVDMQAFNTVLSHAFAMRRKTLRNTLKPLFDSAQIESCDIDPSARAETLAASDFIRLSKLLTP